MTTRLFYCFDKKNKTAISYGPIPETWRNVTGLSDLYEGNYIDLNYAGHDFGFLTFEQATESGGDSTHLLSVKKFFEDVQWSNVKVQRNELLRECDWTELPSVVSNKSAEWQSIWQDYRNQLRNITTQDDPFNIVWPVIPNA